MQNVFLDWGVSKSHVAIVGDEVEMLSDDDLLKLPPSNINIEEQSTS